MKQWENMMVKLVINDIFRLKFKQRLSPNSKPKPNPKPSRSPSPSPSPQPTRSIASTSKQVRTKPSRSPAPSSLKKKVKVKKKKQNQQQTKAQSQIVPIPGRQSSPSLPNVDRNEYKSVNLAKQSKKKKNKGLTTFASIPRKSTDEPKWFKPTPTYNRPPYDSMAIRPNVNQSFSTEKTYIHQQNRKYSKDGIDNSSMSIALMVYIMIIILLEEYNTKSYMINYRQMVII